MYKRQVLESCFRSTKGKGIVGYREAALEGSGIVLQSIIGGTATTCVVFLPLAMLEGMTGQMFKPLGFTIIFCLVASLISAMTIVPLCYCMYRPQEKEQMCIRDRHRLMVHMPFYWIWCRSVLISRRSWELNIDVYKRQFYK